MKTQVVVVLAALLLFAALVRETEGFAPNNNGNFGRKREMEGKV